MKTKPILFTGENVRGILEDRKSMTRRIRFKCEPGDLLYVRETWQYNPYGGIVYRATSGVVDCDGRGWRPSIFMPRSESRLTLRVSNVRVERLQSITVQDIMAEGVRTGAISGQPQYLNPTWCENVGNDFVQLWDSINAKRGYSWESNPEVVVIEWDKVWRQNVDTL